VIFLFGKEYTWRSILFGKELVMSGARWGIGDGKNTQMLTDWWIPGINLKFLKPLISVPENASVSLLIDEDMGAWNADRVQAIFEENVASQIL
jgi:hypothetical protein